MSESDNNTEQSVGGDPQETVESLKAKLNELSSTVESLSAEAAKNRNLRRQAEKERDELKKFKGTQSENEQDYKQLWSESNEKLSKVMEKTKRSDIQVAALAQLQKSKVAQDKVDAALGLIDSSLIEWDETSGVDRQSVTAAVQKLKSQYGFLFETTIAATGEPKVPGDGSSAANTLTRAEFELLSPIDKRAKMKAGVKLI